MDCEQSIERKGHNTLYAVNLAAPANAPASSHSHYTPRQSPKRRLKNARGSDVPIKPQNQRCSTKLATPRHQATITPSTTPIPPASQDKPTQHKSRYPSYLQPSWPG